MYRSLLLANLLVCLSLAMGTGCCLPVGCGGMPSCGLGGCGISHVEDSGSIPYTTEGYYGPAVVLDDSGCSCGDPGCGGCGVPACGGCGSCGLCQGIACTGRTVLGLGAGLLRHVGHGIHCLFSCANACASCGSGCGEVYWHDWINNPPSCDACDSCGHWTGDSIHGLGRTLFSGGCGGMCGHGSPGCAECAAGQTTTNAPTAAYQPAVFTSQRPHIVRSDNCESCAVRSNVSTATTTVGTGVGTGVRVVNQEEVLQRIRQLQQRPGREYNFGAVR